MKLTGGRFYYVCKSNNRVVHFCSKKRKNLQRGNKMILGGAVYAISNYKTGHNPNGC